jgi:hypothetical protein
MESQLNKPQQISDGEAWSVDYINIPEENKCRRKTILGYSQD